MTLREKLARHTEATGWRADAETLERCRRDWCQATAGLVTTLATAEEARCAVEDRHLGGRECLFPELADEWRALTQRSEALAASGTSLGERSGAGAGVPAVEDVQASLEGRPTRAELARTWVELARAEARLFTD